MGFVVVEKDRPGTLQPDKISGIVERNRAALSKMPSLRGQYMKIYAAIKAMSRNEAFTFPDGTYIHTLVSYIHTILLTYSLNHIGTVVKVADVVDPPKKGRKLVILGDTCYSERIARLAMGADILIHEATNAWLKELEGDKYPSTSAMEREVFTHGHSTPQMGEFLHP